MLVRSALADDLPNLSFGQPGDYLRKKYSICHRKTDEWEALRQDKIFFCLAATFFSYFSAFY